MGIVEYQKKFNSYLQQYIENGGTNPDSIKPYYFNAPIQKDGYQSILGANESEAIRVSFHPPYQLQSKHPQLHNHNYFELVYLYHGRCRNQFETGSFEMQPGELLLLNPNCKHNIVSIGGKEDCIVNIMISKKIFEKTMVSLMSGNHLILNFFANYIYNINTTKDYLFFHDIQDPSIPRVIEFLVAEYFDQPMYVQTICQSLLMILLSRLSICYANQLGISPDQPDNNLIVEVLNYMQENCQTITAKEVAEHFGYSTAHIWRIIKKYTGKGYGEILQNFRLQKVEQYLINTNFSLEQIAETMHFSDASYLSKLFKQKFGISPTVYRHQNN
ncbi:helix-turn-helix domain-containing protein [Massilioclostridium coli]|uniref:helix-turn-helix domain-containing protein n=1 Tax=Massilioclostridium coli TaxID=1870991 RepID=UPI0022E67AE8|nr:helix-turn-helix domain-containing protein [Massilioclostridium coli]